MTKIEVVVEYLPCPVFNFMLPVENSFYLPAKPLIKICVHLKGPIRMWIPLTIIAETFPNPEFLVVLKPQIKCLCSNLFLSKVLVCHRCGKIRPREIRGKQACRLITCGSNLWPRNTETKR